MPELLTAEEYAALAKTVDLPQNAFINGGFRPAASGETFETINPATGEVLTEVGSSDIV